MKHNKSPGLDDFPAEFYQSFWEIIKADLMELFIALHDGHLDIFLVKSLGYQRLMEQRGFNNTCRSASLMFILRSLPRLLQ
jgi:hypothetical protein